MPRPHELVVDLQLARRLDLLHGHVEGGVLAREVRRRVVRRERDRDELVSPALRPASWSMKAGNELFEPRSTLMS